MNKYILPILLLFFSNLLSNSISKSKNEIHLWTVLEKKITIDYANDFSSQKVEKFISYFAPNRKINLYQYGKDVTGKNNNGKTIKLYNGNIISSFIRLRIPAKIMAKTLFSRLKKQNYKESKIELLGILIEDNSVMAYIRFDRINNSEVIYQSARGVYRLININNDWYITEMRTYDDDDSVDTLIDYDKMFKPKADWYKIIIIRIKYIFS